MRRKRINSRKKKPVSSKGNIPQMLHNRRSVHDNYRTGHHKMGNARFK